MKKYQLVDEFKKFAIKGNAMDLAVGVIIGGAFGKIVSSLVADILMPLLSMVTGRINLSELKAEFHFTSGIAVTLTYGKFLQSVLDFLLVALSIFFIIKVITMYRKKEEEVVAPPAPTKEELLLTEIRDILKEKKEV